MAQYKLTYFAIRGRGEPIRLLLVEAGQEFTDERVQFADWPALKPSTPFGQLPVLEVQHEGRGFKIAQSITILRFLARKLGFAGGQSELEQATAEMYSDQITDLVNELVKVRFEKDPAKQAELTTKLQNETIPNHLGIFEKRLANNSGFLAGDSLSFADLQLFSTLEWMDEEKREKIFQNFPHIKALDEKIRDRPRIKAYLVNRPQTDM